MMKNWTTTAAGLALAMVSLSGANWEKLAWGDPVEIGSLLQNISIQHCVVGKENGEPVLYFTVAGKPAVFNVVGLEDYRLIDSFPLEGADRSWSHAVATDGSIYIAGVGTGASGHLYRYRPGSDGVEDLGAPVPGHKFIWALTADEEGGVYGGTWEGGHVFHYDAVANGFRDYGRVDPHEDYIRSIAWHGGKIYAGSGARNGRVWVVNPESGEKAKVELPNRPEYADRIYHMRSVYHLAVAGDVLFVFFSSARIMLAYDLKRGEWWEETFTQVRGPVSGVPSPDHRHFIYAGGSAGLMKIDLETREHGPAASFGGSFRGGGWVPSRDGTGLELATVDFGGRVHLVDIEADSIRSLPPLAAGAETPLHTLEPGPDGALHVSGYIGSTGARFDPATGKVETFSVGQAEGITALGDTLFWGIYPGARIKAQPLGTGGAPPAPVEVFQIGHQQDRPFAMTSGGGKLFIGTIPDYGRLGGALAVYDPGKGDDGWSVFPELVENQSIVSLAWHPSGRLFGATSVSGGLGIEPVAEQARLFVWDVAERRKIREWIPEVPGAQSARMISGLSTGPDGNIWGAVNGVVFMLDPESFEIVRHANLYPEVTRYGRWRPVRFRWGGNGFLHANVAGRLTVLNPATMEHRDFGIRSGLLALDAEDNLYYVSGTRLMKVPVKTKRKAAP